MKVKLTASLSGPARAWDAGEEYECSDGEAKRLIEAGFAIPVVEAKTERAVARKVTEKRKK